PKPARQSRRWACARLIGGEPADGAGAGEGAGGATGATGSAIPIVPCGAERCTGLRCLCFLFFFLWCLACLARCLSCSLARSRCSSRPVRECVSFPARSFVPRPILIEPVPRRAYGHGPDRASSVLRPRSSYAGSPRTVIDGCPI